MSTEPIPSPWEQRFPRSVRLHPGDLLVDAATLRVLLSGGKPLDLVCAGHAMEPALPDGACIKVAPRLEPRPGDLALCDAGGWGDVRRLIGRRPDGLLITAIDAFPAGREILRPESILGIVAGIGGRPRRGRRAAAWFHRPISWMSATLHWIRRIERAPDFDEDAMASVARKYAQQVDSYAEPLPDVLTASVDRLLLSRLRPGARVLVAGSGAGREAMSLSRSGFEVVGVDFVPEMVAAARRHAAAAGLRIEYLVADLTTLDCAGRRFDGVYVTPMVYSFIPGRDRRIESLRRIGSHLEGGAPVLFSVAAMRGARRVVELTLAHLRRRRAGRRAEFGDWYTTFLTPQGTLGTSFVHYARPREVTAEIRAAGFTRIERDGGVYFLASGFVPGKGPGGPAAGAGSVSESITGQNDRSRRN